jgi:hypothetical protein
VGLTAVEVERNRRIDESIELLHQAGAEVVTRADPFFTARDWEAEAFLDVWVGRYVRNIASHYHEIIRAPHIGPLFKALRGKPCAVAVVGAGPSLDRNVDQLAGFPGLIIACDRAAKALTAQGIRPDLVVCVDPRPAVMAEMLDYPENRDQRLLLSVYADPEVPRVWRGPIHYMSTDHPGTQFFDRILPELFPGMPMIEASGNVGNTAVQLAAWIGAAKIVLVGQDYCYTGGRMHCADFVRFPDGRWMRVGGDEAYQERKLAQRSGKITFEGEQTYPQFVRYRETLGDIVTQMKLDVINATEGGILTNLPQAPLSAVIAELQTKNYQADGARASLSKATGGGT